MPVGPLPADTLLFLAGRGDFDLVVAIYHDQGHGPVKVLDAGSTVGALAHELRGFEKLSVTTAGTIPGRNPPLQRPYVTLSLTTVAQVSFRANA